MPHVQSSMMTFVTYHEDASELDIAFVGGKTYRYFAVPMEIYEGLLDAGSTGKFFNEQIKDRFAFKEMVRRKIR